MPIIEPAFSTSVFSVDVAGLEAHSNPALCILLGKSGPISVIGRDEMITGDMLLIRPGVEHRVVSDGALRVIYLDGLRWTGGEGLARRLEDRMGDLVLAGLSNEQAQLELRALLGHEQQPLPAALRGVFESLAAQPMIRMSQFELADRLGLERTQALRQFKAVAGTTFRLFKQWTGLQHAARRIVAGDLVRTAALDAGFADSAHLARTFRSSFGLTPSQALAGRPMTFGH